MKKKFLIMSIGILLLSCKYDSSKDKLAFQDVDFVYSLMIRQVNILERLPILTGNACVYWNIEKDEFILNGLNLNDKSINMDSTLISWKISISDYVFLDSSSRKLDSLGVCGAFNTMNIFKFEYNCDENGFGENGRFIFLKERIKEGSNIETVYSVLLDENEMMSLRTL